MTSIFPYLLVAFGGALGASMRFGATQLVTRIAGHGFPYGTMAVNIVGSFAMGLLVVWLAVKVDGGTPQRLALATGVLGGFTTFSAFSLDVHTLLARGLVGQAGLYVLGSVVVALAAIFAGFWIGRLIWH